MHVRSAGLPQQILLLSNPRLAVLYTKHAAVSENTSEAQVVPENVVRSRIPTHLYITTTFYLTFLCLYLRNVVKNTF